MSILTGQNEIFHGSIYDLSLRISYIYEYFSTEMDQITYPQYRNTISAIKFTYLHYNLDFIAHFYELIIPLFNFAFIHSRRI